MATITITSGTSQTGLPISNGTLLDVLSGGTSISATIFAGGSETVESGGHDSGATISSGGTVTVFGSGLSATISSGGTEIVSSGGLALSMTIGSGGTNIVRTSGGATGTVSGGTEIVSAGGSDIFTALSGGTEIVAAGGTAIVTTVSAGGTEIVLAGGQALTNLFSGGTEIVSAGGTALGDVLHGGQDTVLGLTSATTVSAGAQLIVSAGGTARTFSVQAGGSVIAAAGGTAIVTSNSTAVPGLAASGGTILVSSGGTTIGATLSAGGVEIVSSGGFDSASTISSGGTEIVLSGGVANAANDTVLAGGTEILSAGFASSSTVSGGSVIVSSGGTFEFAAITAGGSLTVLSGVSFVGVNSVGAGGAETVAAGGSELLTTLLSGGTATVFGRTISDTVMSGGSEVVGLGGTSLSAAVGSGGTEIALAGGTAIVTSNTTAVFGLEASGGAIQVKSGGTTKGATVDNGGIEVVSSGGTAIATTIGGGGTLDLLSSGVVSGVIQFEGAGGDLAVADVMPSNPVGGFISGGDTIDLQNLLFLSGSTITGTSTTNALKIVEGATSATINLNSADYTGVIWTVQTDIGGGTEIVACFCRGTRILAERGEVAVEELKVGERVKTLSGELKPIVWIGFGRDLVTRTNPLARPIIVRQGALADDVPARDLYLTHGHALYLDGALIPVENLINHRSIMWDETARVVEYYHIELEDHDVVLAESAPAETYYDAGNRVQFHNTRPGSVAGPAKPTCAPVLNGGELVDAVWARLFARTGGVSATVTSDDPDLHLVVDGVRRDPAAIEGSAYTFALDAPPSGNLLLCSRSGVPSLLGINRHDHRRLGVALGRIELCGSGILTTLDPDGPFFVAGGCYPPKDGYCWTDGEFVLPAQLLAHLTGPFTLVVHTERPGMRYPIPDPRSPRRGSLSRVSTRRATQR